MKTLLLLCFLLAGLFIQKIHSQDSKILFADRSVYEYDTIYKSAKLFLPNLRWKVYKIKIKQNNDRIYWINTTVGDPESICSSRLDGSELDTLITNLASPYAFDIDPNNDILVWIDKDDHRTDQDETAIYR